MALTPEEFKELKIRALKLLEWALEDMSPAGTPPLHFKCGFEREGHFVATELPYPMGKSFDYETCFYYDMTALAEAMRSALSGDGRIDRIYHDETGTFLLEAVTKPLGLADATRAIDEISQRMLAEAPRLGIAEAGFGAVPAKVIERLKQKKPLADLEDIFRDYGGEVFETSEHGKILAGRGQHCNISLWLGNKELFAKCESDQNLVNHAATKTLEWMPYMFLPCRRGNYHRIQAKSFLAPEKFKAGNFDSDKAPYLLRYVGDREGVSPVDGCYRLEFRGAVAEADPCDVAIAAATPLVKTCDEAMQKDHGKLTLTEDGKPNLTHKIPFPSRNFGYVPKTEAKASELFNVPDNPYFSYLNELAERKIQRLVEQGQSNPPEIEQLRNIGSRLFEGYCEQYRLLPCAEQAVHVGPALSHRARAHLPECPDARTP